MGRGTVPHARHQLPSESPGRMSLPPRERYGYPHYFRTQGEQKGRGKLLELEVIP